MEKTLSDANAKDSGATIFGYYISDPENYGVVEFDKSGKAVSLEEKPKVPKSKYAVSGLYFYDQQVCSIAKELKPSTRGELEITDLNQVYLEAGNLSVEAMGRGTACLDMCSNDNLASATDFANVIEHRQGLKIACLEEIPLYKGWMFKEELEKAVTVHGTSSYGEYLRGILNNASLSE